MFDLKKLALKDGVFPLELRHPVTDEVLEDGGKKVIINLYGPASREYREATNEQSRRFLKKKNAKEISPEELRAVQNEFYVAVSHSAENFEIEKGVPVDFKKLYSDDSLSWIRSQVEAFLSDTSNFLAK